MASNVRKIIQGQLGHAGAIIDGAKKTGLPLALACAVVEQESAGKNIFGGDYGPAYKGRPPFYEEPVTKAKVKALLGQSFNNGVGLTQLTYRPFVIEAEKLGGAHLPKNQCVVGFKVLKGILDQFGEGALWHYNGSPSYQPQIEAKYAAWKRRLS